MSDIEAIKARAELPPYNGDGRDAKKDRATLLAELEAAKALLDGIKKATDHYNNLPLDNGDRPESCGRWCKTRADKHRIRLRLACGYTKKRISKDTGIPYAQVLRLSKQLTGRAGDE